MIKSTFILRAECNHNKIFLLISVSKYLFYVSLFFVILKKQQKKTIYSTFPPLRSLHLNNTK